MKDDSSKILVIDDDPVIVRMLEKILKMDGYEVLTALSGTAGLQKAKKERPFIILLDVLIPDIDGKEVARELYADAVTRDTPVIFLTITIDVKKDKGEEAIDIDGRSYRAMAKPMHTRKLLSMIRKAVNRRIHSNPDQI